MLQNIDCIAAVPQHAKFIGYDISREAVDLAGERLHGYL